MSQTLELDHVSKTYGPITSLRDISLKLNLGDKVIILGANGSGKTTLLKILSLLIRPSAGTLKLDREALGPHSIHIKRHIGYVGHPIHLYQDLTVSDNLTFFGELHHVPELKKKIETITEEFGIQETLNQTVRTLSQGNQQKVNIIRSLLHEPAILLLDEVFSHLDLPFSLFLEKKIKSCAKDKLIVLCTHRPEIAESIGQRWLILKKGRIVMDEISSSRSFSSVWSQYQETLSTP